MNKIIIPFSDTKSKIPLIDISIDGNHYTALIDTGSESTLFDKKIPEGQNFHIYETDYVMSLVGLSGETEKNQILSVNAVINIDGSFSTGNNNYTQTMSFPLEGIVSDLSNVSQSINERYGKHLVVSLILGSDMLKKYGAKIDYRRQQLTIKR